jgi:integrase
MSKVNDFRVVLIDPHIGGNTELLAELVPEIEDSADLPRNLCDLPLLAIIEDPSGLPSWEATLFLGEVALRSRSIQGDTVRTYAEALLPWLRYLRGKRVALEEVDEETHGLYRAKISNARTSNGEPYASATINLRVVVPELLHLWGERRGVFSSPLGAYLLESNFAHGTIWGGHGRFLRAVRTRPRTRVIKRLPVSLSEEEIRRIVCLAPMPYRLMWKWSVATGLRRFEVCTLRKTILPTPEQIALNSGGLVSLPILRKGSRELSVYAPTALVEETNWYGLMERPSPKDPRNAGLTFLSDAGNPISRQTLSREFRAIADRIGSKATLHHLRHTFAITIYASLERYRLSGEEINPLKTLQILLGHAHSETSEIYTRAASIASEAVMKALDSLFER